MKFYQIRVRIFFLNFIYNLVKGLLISTAHCTLNISNIKWLVVLLLIITIGILCILIQIRLYHQTNVYSAVMRMDYAKHVYRVQHQEGTKKKEKKRIISAL